MSDKKKEASIKNLGEHIGAFARDPERLKKATETRVKNAAERRARKEAVQDGFGLSKLSDPKVQSEMLDDIYEMTKSKDLNTKKWAYSMLNQMNAIKHPEEKVLVEEKKEKEMSAEDALTILKNKGF